MADATVFLLHAERMGKVDRGQLERIPACLNRLKQFVILRESGETILSPLAKMDGPLSRTMTEGGERCSKVTGFALGFGSMEIIECSFCSKSVPMEEAKGQFVAGPKALICRDCVDLTIEIFGPQDPLWRERTIKVLKAMPNAT